MPIAELYTAINRHIAKTIWHIAEICIHIGILITYINKPLHN